MKKIIPPPQIFFILAILLGSVSCFDKIDKKPESPLLLSGTIDLAPDLRPSEDPTAVIFVIARSPEGQIRAVKKLLPPFQFPLAFELGSGDLMIPGMEMKGKIHPSARLDRDGNANPPQAGDILGRAEPETAQVGDRGIKIILGEIVN